ncbi:T-complex protein 1 subunit theta [Coelomomyces lativittatus]|nr:T-complex protein 1 subunit theta [Coelomomyces lativittatus]KAJ1515047.1 T-complex protein 1 subunit theta [Coelomomyces lativittatus]KAJ1516490.1 T-complex protein 1 subunit theta [Coelomomyces lativittatus]
MALRMSKLPSSQIFKEGYKHLQGVDEALLRNINAVCELSQVVQTSFGPNGRNKLIVNHLEKLFVTSDAATIIRELEVIHPAAKLLVMASQAQEAEMGDGTNFVLLFAAELLKKAEYLLKMGLHPSEIVVGYEVALKKALEVLPTLTTGHIKDLTHPDEVKKLILPVLAAKQYGYESFLAPLIVSAVSHVMPVNPKEFNVDSIRVVKILGGSLMDATVVKGMVFGREPETDLKSKRQATVAVYTCALEPPRTETKGTVLLHTADELLGFSKGEENELETLLTKIANKANVVVIGSSVNDLALHFMNRLGVVVVKVPSKFDLRRLCRVTGATALTKLDVPRSEEIGHCDVVETVEIGSDRCTVFRQDEQHTRTCTLVLRGSTHNAMDEMERAIDDAINTVKACTKDNGYVPGAGAAELELSIQLQHHASTTVGLNQYAIQKFAEALEVVPTCIAENSGLDASEVTSKLYAAHQAGQTSMGVNLEGGILDSLTHGIVDLVGTKAWAIRLASDAAITVLRIDQLIMSKPAGGPPVKENKNWDED